FRRVAEENNEIELLITVTPELAEAMDPHQVPPGGPGLNSGSPTDKELYCKGHLEVPRIDGLCPAPGVYQENCGPFEGQPPVELYNPHVALPMWGYPDVPQQTMDPFSGEVIPSEVPTQIAPGVMIM